MKRILLTVLFLTISLIPSIVEGQVVINPTKAQFVASVDHNVIENTVPIVTSYELRIFLPNGTNPMKTFGLSKPTPDANNIIVVTITEVLATLPIGEYTAKVATIGPGGEAISLASNPFQVTVRAPVAATGLIITK
jgi:hypothetical protein